MANAYLVNRACPAQTPKDGEEDSHWKDLLNEDLQRKILQEAAEPLTLRRNYFELIDDRAGGIFIKIDVEWTFRRPLINLPEEHGPVEVTLTKCANPEWIQRIVSSKKMTQAELDKHVQNANTTRSWSEVSKINLIAEHVQDFMGESEFIYRFQFWRKTAHEEVEMESTPEWAKLDSSIVEEDINQFETDLHMHILRRNRRIYSDNDVDNDDDVDNDAEWVTNYELTLTDDDESGNFIP
jgi:hypothetical protein